MREIILITGAAGSGKKYLARLLAEAFTGRNLKFAVIEDVYFGRIENDSENLVHQWNIIAQAKAEFLSKIEKLDGNIIVTSSFENQDTLPLKVDRIIVMAKIQKLSSITDPIANAAYANKGNEACNS
jgi:uridine kinase